MSSVACVMICCDSYNGKGSSVFHAVTAILNQNLEFFEFILIENSKERFSKRSAELEEYIRVRNQHRSNPISIRFIQYKKQLNVNIARNRGANLAQSDIIVFVEDDTILLDDNYLSEIRNIAQTKDFGFGAKRLWTKINWFQNNSAQLLSEIEHGHYKSLLNNAGTIPREYKHISDGQLFETIQGHTFIANFGFVRKSAFLKVNGFPIYTGLDLSDDCLMYRLLSQKYSLHILSSFSVVHVSHFRIRLNSSRNMSSYFNELLSNGHYWCHLYELFKPDNSRKEIIEPLEPIHYDYRLCELYEEYISLPPLNIKDGTCQHKKWKVQTMFSLTRFAQLIRILLLCDTLDEFIMKSKSDFDNLSSLITVSLNYGLIVLNQDGSILSQNLFEAPKIPRKTKISMSSFLPSKLLNQFPCDHNSRLRRFELIINYFPYVEYLRFAIIGDDDMLSPYFIKSKNYIPIVIEADKRIVSSLKEICKDIAVYEIDLRNEKEFIEANIPAVHTFITDPPYTLNGALLFIYRGLSILNDDDEIKDFFVILNETMLGNSLDEIKNILSSCGVYLYNVIENFSQYELPDNFPEKDRANQFFMMSTKAISTVKYSSSSNLYIFRTRKPNLSNIISRINMNDIYNAES